MKLENKVAIVTGSSRGIGRATAIELARNGADVAVNAYSHPEEGREVVREIQALGRRSFLFQGSVADRARDEAMVRETVERLGRLDIMVANAAYSIRKPFLEMEVEEVEKTWGVTLWGVFHCCQLAARQMVKQGDGGSIAIVSSITPRRTRSTSGVSVRTLMPGAAGMVHEAGKPRVPSTSTRHVRHAALGPMSGSLQSCGT